MRCPGRAAGRATCGGARRRSPGGHLHKGPGDGSRARPGPPPGPRCASGGGAGLVASGAPGTCRYGGRKAGRRRRRHLRLLLPAPLPPARPTTPARFSPVRADEGGGISRSGYSGLRQPRASPAAPHAVPAQPSAPRSALVSCAAARAPFRAAPLPSPRAQHPPRSLTRRAGGGAGGRSSRESCRGHRGNFQIRGTRPWAVAAAGLRVPACRAASRFRSAPRLPAGAGRLRAGRAGNCSSWPTTARVFLVGYRGGTILPRAPATASAAGESGRGAVPELTGSTPTHGKTTRPAEPTLGPQPLTMWGLACPPVLPRGNPPRWGDGLLGPVLPTCVPLIAGATCPPWGTWLLLKMDFRGARPSPGTRPHWQGQHPLPLASAGKLSLEIGLLTSSLQAWFVWFYTSLQTHQHSCFSNNYNLGNVSENPGGDATVFQ